MRGTTRKTVLKARALRRAMTQPEARLWQILRARPAGLKFRHQHPIGPYSLDFYCPGAKLAIEVDGDAHDMGDMPARDAARDAWLERRGVRTLRIPARDLYGDVEAAIIMILASCGVESPSTALHAVPLPTSKARRED
jgi:very-short-patch-repair endonuclease